ncbi:MULTISPECIES: DUF6891 domain-containing protein [unclassified Nocardioides]|uniref:DUF6891 domain-containing protein n=1 Tax=unclassified Nocardioides TaxID=2615069 RepID=UPI0012E3D4EF|nr:MULTISPECIES: hypothetical protein [unclassified Nocardioides]
MTRGARRTPEEELVDFARLQVRAGLLSSPDMLAEVVQAIDAEMPGTDATILARAWLAKAGADLRSESGAWPETTDFDRLQAVFAECASHGVRVLQGVADHWAAKAELERDGASLRGILWFTPPDVWHAIDEGMLEVNLWHASTANAAPGDHLLDAVLSCFSRHGLTARFDEGRIEVTAFWQRRPAP